MYNGLANELNRRLFSETPSTRNVCRQALRLFTFVIIGCLLSGSLSAQENAAGLKSVSKRNVPTNDELSPAAAKVDINPLERDDEIGTRLERVLRATDWFEDPRVRVQEGVVFLNGLTETDELKLWAGDLARNTQGVVAVANRMEVREPSIWNFEPARKGVRVLWRDFLRTLPFFVFGVVILALSVGAGLLGTKVARALLRQRIQSKLLRNVVARATGVLVLLLGVYVILRVSGLTQLALTVVGGTGLIGLAVGIAFRDITENFLASIFLSVQQPFETRDLVEVAGVTGYVQQLNMRTTILMTLNGNLVQIPNATVYKSNLRNFTTNCNRREDFVIGIGYDDAINEAQEIARRVLADHPAVLDDPEPSVLVDNLGTSTVNLRVYFWLNGREHGWLKVRSSVIRLVKRAFQENGISMPDEAREVVFPRGVPIAMVEPPAQTANDSASPPRVQTNLPHQHLDAASTDAEAGLYSEAGVIEEQARQAKPFEEGENLLRDSSDNRSTENQPNA